MADGRGLREALAEGPVHALLLDLMLPGEDGLSLCRWLRQQPDWHALPVLMLTAQGDPASRVTGLELGADDYLAKPFEPRELVARIHTVLRRAGPASARRARRPPVCSPSTTGAWIRSATGCSIATVRR